MTRTFLALAALLACAAPDARAAAASRWAPLVRPLLAGRLSDAALAPLAARLERGLGLSPGIFEGLSEPDRRKALALARRHLAEDAEERVSETLADPKAGRRVLLALRARWAPYLSKRSAERLEAKIAGRRAEPRPKRSAPKPRTFAGPSAPPAGTPPPAKPEESRPLPGPKPEPAPAPPGSAETAAEKAAFAAYQRERLGAALFRPRPPSRERREARRLRRFWERLPRTRVAASGAIVVEGPLPEWR